MRYQMGHCTVWSGREEHTVPTTYELWDLVSRNLIDFFEDRQEAMEVVQAYVDADEAAEVVLIQCDDAKSENRSLTGGELIAWLERARADMQRTA